MNVRVILMGDAPQLTDWRGTYGDALSKVLDDAELWWASKGVELSHEDPTVQQYAIDPAEQNPWYRTLAWLNERGFPTDGSILYLCVLDGWDNPSVAGWGGRPLALVGEWFLRAIESSGNPEAIVDDWQAGYVVMHEQGHAMGLPHDFARPCCVMGYGFCGFNALLYDMRPVPPDPTAGPGIPLPCELRPGGNPSAVSEQVDDFRGRVAAILRSGHSAYVMVQDIKALFKGDPESGEILDAGNLPR